MDGTEAGAPEALDGAAGAIEAAAGEEPSAEVGIDAAPEATEVVEEPAAEEAAGE